MEGKKAGDGPCGLQITATDFNVFVRDEYFCVYLYGRKEEGRKEIILVGCIAQIQSSVYVLRWISNPLLALCSLFVVTGYVHKGEALLHAISGSNITRVLKSPSWAVN